MEENDITQGTKLKDLSLDSLSLIEVIVKIEEEFSIEFDDEELYIGKWEKIEDIICREENQWRIKNRRHESNEPIYFSDAIWPLAKSDECNFFCGKSFI